MTQNLEEVKEQARKAAAELLEAANLAAGSILVTGCSSSEMPGPVSVTLIRQNSS